MNGVYQVTYAQASCCLPFMIEADCGWLDEQTGTRRLKHCLKVGIMIMHGCVRVSSARVCVRERCMPVHSYR